MSLFIPESVYVNNTLLDYFCKPEYIILKSNIICPICLDLFETPVTTTCGHVFCEHCFFNHKRQYAIDNNFFNDKRKYMKFQSSHKDVCTMPYTICPVCRKSLYKE